MSFLTDKTGITLRAFVALMIVIALVVQGIIPAGYMPDAAHASGRTLAFKICTGTQNAPAKNQGGHTGHKDAACPYSVSAGFLFDGLAAPGFISFFFILVAVLGFGIHLPTPQHRRAFASPRAPPFLF
jgi:hypothetical protein